MSSRKKFKNLLNSISNGSEMEGTLQKIREMFFTDLQGDIEKLKPDFTQIEAKINKLGNDLGNSISDKEKKASDIITNLQGNIEKLKPDYTQIEARMNKLVNDLSKNISDKEKKALDIQKVLKETSLNGVDEKLRDVKEFLSNIDGKIRELGSAREDILKILNEGHSSLQDSFKNTCDDIMENRRKLLVEIFKNKDDIISSIREELEERKSNLSGMVDNWEQLIKDKTDTFEKEFNLYIEKRGVDKIIEYVQNNAFKLLWTLFVGIFKKYQQKKT